MPGLQRVGQQLAVNSFTVYKKSLLQGQSRNQLAEDALLPGRASGQGSFSSSVCQPGLVHLRCCKTKISVTRLDAADRLPSISISPT